MENHKFYDSSPNSIYRAFMQTMTYGSSNPTCSQNFYILQCYFKTNYIFIIFYKNQYTIHKVLITSLKKI